MNIPLGRWTHPPVAAIEDHGDLLVTAAEGSDAWRLTSYGFVHDSEHALLAPFLQDSAMEVVEFADGTPSLGAVVTDGRSDCFLAPVAGAGPLTCAPTRAGFTVAFHAWRITEPDAGLH